MTSKVFDGLFDFPSLQDRGPAGRCRLRVYEEPELARRLVVATELADNPGASVTNGVAGLLRQVWATFQPNTAQPPFLFEHYGRASYHYPASQPVTDRFALAECLAELPTDWAEVTVSLPVRWSHIPAALVQRLVGEPVGEAEQADPVPYQTTVALTPNVDYQLGQVAQHGITVKFIGTGPAGELAEVIVRPLP